MRTQITTPHLLYRRLHRLAQWFHDTYAAFTCPVLCVPAILERKSILLTSPTGSGKTLAGFRCLRFPAGLTGSPHTSAYGQCIYVSPLRSRLRHRKKSSRAHHRNTGLEKKLRLHLRTGSTQRQNVKFRQRPAHFHHHAGKPRGDARAGKLYHLGDCWFVILDELHSFAGNAARITTLRSSASSDLSGWGRRAAPSADSHRLRSGQAPRDVPTLSRRVSATAAPLDLLARFLVGEGRECRIGEARMEKNLWSKYFLRSAENIRPQDIQACGFRRTS
jgi:ATP-dependent Lhr-like helicase